MSTMTMAEQNRLSARRAAELIRRELVRSDEDFALRYVNQAISDMRKAGDDLDDFLVQPDSVGDRGWDALLATAVRWECERQGRIPPDWTDAPALDRDWFVWPGGEPSPEWAARIRSRTPQTFAAKRIFITERDFETA